MSTAQRATVLELGRRQTLAKGAVLIHQGHAARDLHFLLSGELGITLNEAQAEPIALVARTACELLSLDEGAFWELVHASHPFALNLLVKLAERLRRNNATVSSNIEKRRLFERAAMFDGLTGIHNRRWLDETLHRLVERHERDEAPLCLALIDIDHFKRFNDDPGHDAGDLVLSTVASTMEKSLRPTDLVARFGGEEFVILFPHTTPREAEAAGERVRVVVAQTTAALPGGQVLPRVTISMGIAAMHKSEPPRGAAQGG